jgi:hypothetical protein
MSLLKLINRLSNLKQINMTKSCEEIYIKNVENGIRGIRLGAKKPEDVSEAVASNLNRLNKVNEGMYEELMRTYENVVNDYRNRTAKKISI